LNLRFGFPEECWKKMRDGPCPGVRIALREAADACARGDSHDARIGLQIARDDAQEGALAAAVRPHDAG